jgi:hypothetical protein
MVHMASTPAHERKQPAASVKQREVGLDPASIDRQHEPTR